MSVLYETTNRIDDAIACCEEAKRIWTAALPPQHPDIQDVNNLIDLLKQIGVEVEKTDKGSYKFKTNL